MLRIQLPLRATIALLLASLAPAQTTWWVDAAGSAPGSGSFGDPYTELGFALAAASTVDGDTLNVRPGTYLEHDVDFLGKAVRVVSTQGALATIVDAERQGSCVVFQSGEGPTSSLEGLTLRNGSGTPVLIGVSLRPAGGGLIALGASPTIIDCLLVETQRNPVPDFGGGAFLQRSSAHFIDCEFRDNSAGQGGGVALIGGSPLFEGCSFLGNGNQNLPTFVHPFSGGGVYSQESAPLFRACVFSGNLAARGGGISGPARVEDSLFEANWGQFGGAVDGSSAPFPTVLVRCQLIGNFGLGYTGEDGFGGGAYNATLLDCAVIGNVSSAGGGVNRCHIERSLLAQNIVYDVESAPDAGFGGGAFHSSLVACAVFGNEAQTPMFTPSEGGGVYGRASHPSSLEHCVVYDNEADLGAGVSGASVVRCTIFGNRGLTAQGALDCALDSSIVRGHAENAGGATTATYSNIEGGLAGQGNIDAGARFVDSGGGDFHLLLDSPCIDAGNPNAPRDLDGSRADMGAFSSADCNDNLVPDPDDLAAMTSPDANGNGFPDECECFVAGVCESSANSSGQPAVLSTLGSVRLSANDLTLVASAMPAGRNGLFFYGSSPASSPFGDGTRCISGQVRRLAPLTTDAQGQARVALDTTTLTQPGGAPTTPGTLTYFQFFFRDPAGPGGSGFNLSDALRVRFCD